MTKRAAGAVLVAAVIALAVWGRSTGDAAVRRATPVASLVASPIGAPASQADLAATVAALEATVAAQGAGLVALDLRVADLEEDVATLLKALVEQTAQDGFQQDQIDDLNARMADIEADDGSGDGRAASARSDAHTIRGSVVLHDPDGNWRRGRRCQGSGGYSDIRAGADVVIRDGDGNIIASGRLGEAAATSSTSCRLSFVVEDVPRADFYTVEVGGRGGPSYSYEDLDDAGWEIDLEIGR
jgi:hypothetical protein